MIEVNFYDGISNFNVYIYAIFCCFFLKQKNTPVCVYLKKNKINLLIAQFVFVFIYIFFNKNMKLIYLYSLISKA